MSVPIPSVAQHSDSLIGSLCREVDALRSRVVQLSHALVRCQNSTLWRRLHQERQRLLERRHELLQVARIWQSQEMRDPLAIEFLVEITSRPMPG